MGCKGVSRDGYGYGYGSGYGSGYDDGYGYGYGSGYGEYIKLVLSLNAGDKGKKLEQNGAILAFWRSKADGTPYYRGGEARKAGDVEVVKGPLEISSERALHGTLTPEKWKGEKLWVVALYPPTVASADKIGSLKREIICSIRNFYE